MLKRIKKAYHTVNVKNKQRKVKKQIKKEGLTDEILEKQVEINTLKNKHDIVMNEDKVYEDYVQ